MKVRFDVLQELEQFNGLMLKHGADNATLRDLIVQCLLHEEAPIGQPEAPSPEVKWAREELCRTVFNEDSVELSVTQIEEIKTLAGLIYETITIGPLFNALESGEPIPDLEPISLDVDKRQLSGGR